jgi:hypothetical protein
MDVAVAASYGIVGRLEIARGPRMGKTSALFQSQRLRGRLECARYRIIVNGLAAGSRGRGREGEVANGYALEMSKFPVLSLLVSRAEPVSWTYPRMAKAMGAREAATAEARELAHCSPCWDA